MNRSRILRAKVNINPLLIVLALFFLLTPVFSSMALSKSNGQNKQKIARNIAEQYIMAGKENYRRGRYMAAESDLLRAKNYEDYLSSAQKNELSQHLEKAHLAAVERRREAQHQADPPPYKPLACENYRLLGLW